MAYDKDNIFARIIRGEIPCHRVYEDADTLAFMDIMPQAEGHTLVIPKSAGEDLFTTPPESVAAAIRTTQVVAPTPKPKPSAVPKKQAAPSAPTKTKKATKTPTYQPKAATPKTTQRKRPKDDGVSDAQRELQRAFPSTNWPGSN